MYIKICVPLLILHQIFRLTESRVVADFIPGPCPESAEQQILKNFSQDKFQGAWYIIQQHNPEGLDCIKMNFTWIPKERKFRHYYAEIRSHQSASSGLRNLEEIKKNSNNGAYFDGRSNYYIIDTDYKNYAVLWNCEDSFKGDIFNSERIHWENLIVVGRDRHYNIDTNKSLSDTLAKSPFERSKLSKVNQDDPVCYKWKGVE